MSKPTPKSAIGLIGLATMGANLARNIASKGFQISVFNRTTEKTEKFIKACSACREHSKLEANVSGANSNFTGTYSLKEFIATLETPRKIILLVKAGSPVDDIIAELTPLLAKNDIIIDCGNSHFKDTEKRQNELTKKGLNFIGCGISGGEEGALHGPSLMPGGDKNAWEKICPIFEKIAAKDFQGKPCVTHLGPSGSGHFVKMVHNGIEYAIMQLLAESYHILKNLGKFSNSELSKIFSAYNNSPNLKSFLIEITTKIFARKDNLIDLIKDSAGQKGTGKWTTEAALTLGVAIPTINAAVDARIISGDPRVQSRKLLKRTIGKLSKNLDKKTLIHQLRDALELATELSYEQGFQLLMKANQETGWNLNLSEIARIWQGGCIIRSDYLLKLEQALGGPNKEKCNLEMVANFAGKKQLHLRHVISLAVLQGIPIPAFYSTLAYYDAYSAPHLPQNLIQAQRDFFGAHGYERTDKPGTFHTDW